MIYDKYKAKILSVMRVLNTIKRFRVLILSVIVAVTATVTGLLAARGSVYGESELPTEITYGETFEPKAKAFLSSVDFEYSAKDSEEWTAAFPTKPGEYKVRPVADATFGDNRYGDIHTFVIKAKAATVSAMETQIAYGGTPTATIDQLVAGDTLTCSDFTFIGVGTDTVQVEPDLTSATIVNADGADVTACYALTPERTEIALLARKISIDIADQTHVYDGTAFHAEEYTLSENALLAGDELQATFDKATVQNVGDEAAVKLTDYKVYNASGTDVTRYYTITNMESEAGKLSVTPREIVVETQSDEKTYDGTPLTQQAFEFDRAQLVDGHEIEVVDYATLTKVGSIPNTLTMRITDASGAEVTANYSISFSETSRLTVNPKALTLTTGGIDEAEYNGNFWSNETIGCEGLVATDELEEGNAVFTKQKNVTGTNGVENVVTNYRIVNADGENVTDCYDITTEWGKIIVLPKALTVTSASDEKNYDGKAFVLNEATCSGIVGGEELTVEWGDASGRVKVGVYDNEFTVKDDSVSRNYTITPVFGKLKIEKRAITITSKNAEKPYDGTPLTCHEVEISGEDGLAETDELDISYTGAQTNAYNASFGDENGQSENAFTLNAITHESLGNVTDCYAITTETGTLTVNKARVELVSASDEKTYDGYSFTKNEMESVTGLVAGEELTIEWGDASERVIVGDYDNAFAVTLDSVSANYTITPVCGKLTIKQRAITITSKNAEKIYDGTPLTCHEVEIGGLGLAETDKNGLTISYTGAQTNAYNASFGDEYGQSENTFTLNAITHESLGDVTDCYTITAQTGTLTVYKRSIKITTGSLTEIYNGSAWTEDACEIERNDEPYGQYEGDPILETYSISINGEQTNVGSSINTYSLTIGGDTLSVPGSGKIYFGNYLITSVLGTITVTPRPIFIKQTHSHEWTYDGEAHYDDSRYTDDDLTLDSGYYGFVDGHYVIVNEALCSKYTNVRRENNEVCAYENELQTGWLIVYDDNDNVVTENYDISITDSNFGTMLVKPRELKITTTHTHEWIYDGNEHHDECTYTNGNLDSSSNTLVDGHYFTIAEYTSITDVLRDNGEVIGIENVLKFNVMDGTNAPTTSNYNIVILKYGTLKISPRPISIRVLEDEETEYNGKPQKPSKQNEYESVDTDYWLVDGHSLSVETDIFDEDDNDVYVTNVWELAYHRISSVDVFDSNGQSVLGNYDVDTGEAIEFRLQRREITITALSAWKYYDGTDLTMSSIYEVTHPVTDPIMHVFEAETDFKPFKNVQKIEHNVKQDTVRVSVEGEYTLEYKGETHEIYENYLATFVAGELEIKKRPITIQSATDSKIYDGTPLTNTDWQVTANDEQMGDPILSSHEATVAVTGTITDVQRDNDGNVIGVENTIGSITITDENGDDVTDCYEITRKEGTLTVKPRPVTVTAGSNQKTYDGKAIDEPNPNYEVAQTGEDSGLIAGHTLTAQTSYKNTYINAGSYPHTIEEAAITDGSGEDVTGNYDFTFVDGTLTIDKKEVKYEASSIEKIYDGTPLTGGIDLTNADLVDGHTIEEYASTTLTDVDSQPNRLNSIKVTDEEGNDVTDNYNFVCESTQATVTVSPRPITVTTEGKEAPYYEGVKLTNANYELGGEEALADEPISVITTGVATEEGVPTPNSFKLTIGGTDINGVEITESGEQQYGNYLVTAELGTLLITESEEDPDGGDGEGSGEGDGSGEGGAGEGGLNGDLGGGRGNGQSGNNEPGKPVTLFYLTSTEGGTVYLRMRSYGVYDPSTNLWGETTPYTDASTSPLYWIGTYLFENGYTKETMTLELVDGATVPYMIPYYTAMSHSSDTSDVSLVYEYSNSYTLDYYAYDDCDIVLEGNAATWELAYRDYVKNHSDYLTLGSSALQSYFAEVIVDHGWDKITDKTKLINEVAKYIQISATYNLKFNQDMQNEPDPLLAFLTEYKEGVCEHYAGAATLLYRQLGIPARYTVGYAPNVVAGEETEVTNMMAHAWVEVYVDGMGWVNVEVTGSGGAAGGSGGLGGGDGGSGGENGGQPPKLGTLKIKPTDVKEVYGYDGKPLTHDGVSVEDVDGETLLANLLAKGYTYEATTTSDTLTDIGVGYSNIETFVLYDSKDEDVTEFYNLDIQVGKVVYSGSKLVIDLPHKEKYYDGQELKYAADEQWTLNTGETVVGSGVEIDITFDLTTITPITNVGKVTDKELLTHVQVTLNGVDVTGDEELCIIEFSESRLHILPNELILEAGSATKPYDGEPLTYDYATVAVGNLISGHTLVYTTIGEQTEVGVSINYIQTFAIRDANGKDVTNNYIIKKTRDGTLTVTE